MLAIATFVLTLRGGPGVIWRGRDKEVYEDPADNACDKSDYGPENCEDQAEQAVSNEDAVDASCGGGQ